MNSGLISWLTFSLVVCLVFDTSLAIECAQEKNTQMYVENLCHPSAELNNNGCPLYYDCSVLQSVPPSKCFYNGVTYSASDVFKREENSLADKCIEECVCQKDGTFRCVYTDCPEIQVAENCLAGHSLRECCPTAFCPTAEQKNKTCSYGIQFATYGSLISNEGSTCVCNEYFDGKFDHPVYCRKDGCDPHLRHTRASVLTAGAPVYTTWGNCPVGWIEHDPTDYVLRKNPPTAYAKAPKCKFATLVLSIGDTLKKNNGVMCECSTPPMLTCVDPRIVV